MNKITEDELFEADLITIEHNRNRLNQYHKDIIEKIRKIFGINEEDCVSYKAGENHITIHIVYTKTIYQEHIQTLLNIFNKKYWRICPLKSDKNAIEIILEDMNPKKNQFIKYE